MSNRLRYAFVVLLTASLLISACTGSASPSKDTETPSSGQSGTTEAPAPEQTEAADVPDEQSAADLQYEENGAGITITGYTGSASTLRIPEKIGDRQVTAIGESCFAGLLCLEKVTVPEGVVSIGDYAFECCSCLKKIYLPESLKQIGDGAFSGCVSLTLVDMQEGVETIGRGAFLCCGALVYQELPESLTEIGAFAFSGCTSLASAVFGGDNVSSLPDRIFYDCPALAVVRLPEGITSVGKRAFSGCTGLKYLYFATPLDHLGDQAFEGCESVTGITVSAPAIGRETFAGCASLNYYGISEDTASIGYRAFMTSGITSLDIPGSVTDIAEGAFAVSNITSLYLEDNPNYTLIGGSLYTADGKTLLCSLPEDPYAEEPETAVTIPDGVETIAGYAFSCNPYAERVTLPASVRTVCANAFTDSGVYEAVIPETAEVSPDAFTGSPMEEYKEEPEPQEQEEMPAPENTGSAAGDSSLFDPADFEGYITIANDEFETWSEKYLEYNSRFNPIDQELYPYTMMYKGEVIPHYMPMTYVQNHDPEMGERAAQMFGDDFEETYIMMNHGLFTELRRGRMCDDLLLYSGVYDSQLMAAAGTDTVPTQEELIAAIGSEFTDPVMISTTTDIGVACNFSDTLFVIYASREAMESLGAISIDSYVHTNENEILMSGGARYRLLDVGTMAVETTDEEDNPVTVYRNYVTVQLLGK